MRHPGRAGTARKEEVVGWREREAGPASREVCASAKLPDKRVWTRASNHTPLNHLGCFKGKYIVAVFNSASPALLRGSLTGTSPTERRLRFGGSDTATHHCPSPTGLGRSGSCPPPQPVRGTRRGGVRLRYRECPSNTTTAPPQKKKTKNCRLGSQTQPQTWPALDAAVSTVAVAPAPCLLGPTRSCHPTGRLQSCLQLPPCAPAGGLGNLVFWQVLPGTSDWWSYVTCPPTAAGEAEKCSFRASTVGRRRRSVESCPRTRGTSATR